VAGRDDLYEYCIKQRRSCYEARAPQPLYKQNRVQPAAALHQNRPGPGAPRRSGIRAQLQVFRDFPAARPPLHYLLDLITPLRPRSAPLSVFVLSRVSVCCCHSEDDLLNYQRSAESLSAPALGARGQQLRAPQGIDTLLGGNASIDGSVVKGCIG
jgi:hypothetical protein